MLPPTESNGRVLAPHEREIAFLMQFLREVPLAKKLFCCYQEQLSFTSMKFADVPGGVVGLPKRRVENNQEDDDVPDATDANAEVEIHQQSIPLKDDDVDNLIDLVHRIEQVHRGGATGEPILSRIPDKDFSPPLAPLIVHRPSRVVPHKAQFVIELSGYDPSKPFYSNLVRVLFTRTEIPKDLEKEEPSAAQAWREIQASQLEGVLAVEVCFMMQKYLRDNGFYTELGREELSQAEPTHVKPQEMVDGSYVFDAGTQRVARGDGTFEVTQRKTIVPAEYLQVRVETDSEHDFTVEFDVLCAYYQKAFRQVNAPVLGAQTLAHTRQEELLEEMMKLQELSNAIDDEEEDEEAVSRRRLEELDQEIDQLKAEAGTLTAEIDRLKAEIEQNQKLCEMWDNVVENGEAASQRYSVEVVPVITILVDLYSIPKQEVF